jgi:hypothetical protein
MPYEDIPIAHVLNYWLADGFDASGQTNVLDWLGEGKSLTDMLGKEASNSFYALWRRQEIARFIAVYDLHELQCYLNDRDDQPAVLLGFTASDGFVFSAGDREGTPAIVTEWFKRDRANVLR